VSRRAKPLRVLVIAQYYPPDLGGATTRAYNAVKGLKINGAHVTVIAAVPHYPHGNVPKEYRWKPLKIEWQEGVKVIRTFVPPLPSKGVAYRLIIFSSFIFSSLLAFPAVRKADVIWAANPNVISFFPSMIFGLFMRAPVVLNADDLWPEDMYGMKLLKPKSFLAKIAETMARIAYHKAKAITPISPLYRLIICGRYGVDPKKVVVIRGGVDTSKFKPCSRRERSGKFTVLYSGAFSVAYDFEQVLQAAKLLQSENIEFILQGSGEVAPLLKKRVKELKLSNVKVIDKVLTREEVAKLLCQADALILPLREFGYPYLGISIKLYEYQAVGKPVLCVARGAPALHVLKTRSGLISRPGDVVTLARSVLELARNLKKAEEMGINGRTFVQQEASLEKIGAELFNTLARAARRHVQPQPTEAQHTASKNSRNFREDRIP
jgi:glycosyltransferase involved in cell wall biosynthesis